MPLDQHQPGSLYFKRHLHLVRRIERIARSAEHLGSSDIGRWRHDDEIVGPGPANARAPWITRGDVRPSEIT